MGKAEKLRDRLFSRPSDFTWDELTTLLTSHYDFTLLNGGGSRRKFVHIKTKMIISLHQPHPGNIIKMYAIKQVIQQLEELKQLEAIK